MVKVDENIYIGNINSPIDISTHNNNIKLIINISNQLIISKNIPTIYISQFKDIDFDVLNYPQEVKTKYMNRFKLIISNVCYIINKEVQKKNNVLIHCYAGMNRSATIIASYLILYKNKTYEEAINLLTIANKKRNMPVILNNSYKKLLKNIYDFHIK